MSAQNLEVNDILFTNNFTDFEFEYPTNIEVSTIINLYKYLSEKISNDSTFITSEKVLEYAKTYN